MRLSGCGSIYADSYIEAIRYSWGGIFMIVLNRDGLLTTEGTPERAARWVKDTIEVPEDAEICIFCIPR